MQLSNSSLLFEGFVYFRTIVRHATSCSVVNYGLASQCIGTLGYYCVLLLFTCLSSLKLGEFI